jgi:entry exclusion lipoprotein TrbK
MPAVNDENCKPEVIRTIEDKGRREQFASLCLRRGPRFKASENKAW